MQRQKVQAYLETVDRTGISGLFRGAVPGDGTREEVCNKLM